MVGQEPIAANKGICFPKIAKRKILSLLTTIQMTINFLRIRSQAKSWTVFKWTDPVLNHPLLIQILSKMFKMTKIIQNKKKLMIKVRKLSKVMTWYISNLLHKIRPIPASSEIPKNLPNSFREANASSKVANQSWVTDLDLKLAPKIWIN